MRTSIVTFVSSPYIPVGHNWLSSVLALQPDAEIVIVALDHDTKSAFEGHPVNVLFRPMDKEDLASLWVHRLEILIELFDQGHDLVHSDADAVWVKNPLPYMQSAGADMVYSQGTVWPPDVHGKRGLVLCCGLFYLRNKPDVRGFLGRVAKRSSQERDDQVSVNRELDDMLDPWKIESAYAIPFRETTFTASREPIRGSSPCGVTVAVMPHHLVPRVMVTLDDDVLVAHPFSGKTCHDKENVLSALGLWNIESPPVRNSRAST